MSAYRFISPRQNCAQVSPSNVSFYLRSLKLDTDNAAMIAWCSMHRFLAGDYDDYTVDLRAKWSIEDIK